MKDKKVEERVFFRIVKSKKRKPKQEPIGTRLFDVKKYSVPNGSSSNKELPPSSGSEGSEAGDDQAKKDCSSNESMHSAEPTNQVAEIIAAKPSTPPKKALDYSLTKKLFSIVRRPSVKEKEFPIQ